MSLKLVILTIVVNYAYSHAQESRLVTTLQGSVRGYREGDIFVFYSIPYATAPTGVDKFKAPLDAPVWTETFEALNRGIICPQISYHNVTEGFSQQEDCLVATVYVPDTETLHLPVVVYVHGGAYQVGFGDSIPPYVLANSQRVIAVTFNYRLGPHGFLCLGTEDIPGNAGMKDQLAALNWVKNNIASFGGNPEDVTIDGYSAGSSSVDLMILSKSASGLFQKVIPESGANIAAWSVQLDPIENAKEFARELGFIDVGDIYALENFYKSITMNSLTSIEDINNVDSTIYFVPCIERDVGQERFLDDSPVNILRGGDYIKVPMLYGFSQMEGLIRLEDGVFDEWSIRMNEKFSDFLPADLHFESTDQKEKVAEEVKRFYFGDAQVDESTIFAYIDYFSDTMFKYPHLRALRLQVEAGNNEIYLYEYSFMAEEIQSMHETIDVRGPGHCAQTDAVLADSTSESLTNRSRQMYSLMQDVWLNFITTGTPVREGSSLPAWPPAGANRGPYMDFDEVPQLRETPIEARAQFWDNLYDQYYRQPIPPEILSNH